MALKQRNCQPDARGTLAGVRVLDLSRAYGELVAAGEGDAPPKDEEE